MGRNSKLKYKLSVIFLSVSIKNVCYLSIIFNSISIIFGIIYLIFPIYSVLWDIFGIIYIITLFLNCCLVYHINLRSKRISNTSIKLKKLSFYYLIFTTLSMVGMLFGNTLISITYSSAIIDNLIGYSLIYVSFFGLLIFGIFISYYEIINSKNEKVGNQGEKKLGTTENNKIKINKTPAKKYQKGILISKITCISILLIGLVCSDIIVRGTASFPIKYIDVSQFALFFAFIFLSVTFILLNLKDKRKNPQNYYFVAIIGLFISGICISPLCLTPHAINIAEVNFAESFGNDWRSSISLDAEKYFLKTPFSIPEYFLGNVPKDCIIMKNVLFYNGSNSKFEVDRDLKLYFDVYMPLNYGEGLPGENSTLIRIHGGSWSLGDKGLQNMMQMNKYFASLGYIVFDIQYGLYHANLEHVFMTPDYVRGNFSMNDMIRHVGIFTKYIQNHSIEYGTNLDSVFISGSSAGGQIACVTALAINSGNYTEIFGSGLTIKGLIPYYPANIVAGEPIVPGDVDPKFLNPELLVDGTSPPCLIYHGLADGQIPPIVAESLKYRYNSNENYNCAILWMPAGAHMSDIYFSSYYNQVFLYYMERFMQIFK